MPRSSREEVVKTGENAYKVYVHEAAVEGKANKKLIEIISEHFGVKKKNIRIARGLKAKSKIIEIASGAEFTLSVSEVRPRNDR